MCLRGLGIGLCVLQPLLELGRELRGQLGRQAVGAALQGDL